MPSAVAFLLSHTPQGTSPLTLSIVILKLTSAQEGRNSFRNSFAEIQVSSEPQHSGDVENVFLRFGADGLHLLGLFPLGL